MSDLTLIFSRGDDWISRLIRFFTRSRFSHVALVSPDGTTVIESTGLTRPDGVQQTPLDVWQARHPGFELRAAHHPNPESVWAIACSQMGKPYDNSYIWGWLLHRNWQAPDRWACHELIFWSAYQTGFPLLDMRDAGWLTPQHLFLISKPGGDAAALLDGTSSAAS